MVDDTADIFLTASVRLLSHRLLLRVECRVCSDSKITLWKGFQGRIRTGSAIRYYRRCVGDMIAVAIGGDTEDELVSGEPGIGPTLDR